MASSNPDRDHASLMAQENNWPAEYAQSAALVTPMVKELIRRHGAIEAGRILFSVHSYYGNPRPVPNRTANPEARRWWR